MAQKVITTTFTCDIKDLQRMERLTEKGKIPSKSEFIRTCIRKELNRKFGSK